MLEPARPVLGLLKIHPGKFPGGVHGQKVSSFSQDHCDLSVGSEFQQAAVDVAHGTLPCASTTIPEPGCASTLDERRAQRPITSRRFICIPTLPSLTSVPLHCVTMMANLSRSMLPCDVIEFD